MRNRKLINVEFSMKKERKIKMIARKVTFAEAEIADDEYWAKASPEERLKELVELRKLNYGNITDSKTKKVVFKRSIHDEK